MAVTNDDNIFVNTYDKTYLVERASLSTVFYEFVKSWDWIRRLKLPAAQEYFHRYVDPALESITSAQKDVKSSQPISVKRLVAPDGSLGNFISSTRLEHGDLVAFFILQIATQDSLLDDNSNYIKSDALKKNTTYEYNLAQYLYFQFLGAADYIVDNTSSKFSEALSAFEDKAGSSLKEIENSRESIKLIGKNALDTQRQLDARQKYVQRKRLRRYRKVFDGVRKEAAVARNEAMASRNEAAADLKAAYDTYHAQVDLNSSIVYWSAKVVKHDRSRRVWLCAVIISMMITFIGPAAYYALGGVSALAAWRHSDLQQAIKVVANTPSNQEVVAQGEKANAPTKDKVIPSITVETVAVASGIADLTGAALLVALLSVLLRLSLRQYNTAIYLGHDAEERITMLKTYLALSNEGKLTADGDMKLVLETLFRASQTGGVADASPTTPIELIVKAITERKP